MSVVRVYINTFDEIGNYVGFEEVTSDVNEASFSKVSQKLDNNEYDVGVLKNTNLNLKLTNERGKYSEPGVSQSIFKFKRINSLVKVTWAEVPQPPICGIAICGTASLASEENVFYGLLNDIATQQDISDQEIAFSCQGLESVFERVETNFSSLSVSDTLSDTLFNLLNQTAITSIMNVSASNINPGLDFVPDSIAELEETTVKEALDELTTITNSVIWIDPNTLDVIIKERTVEPTSSYTFYGQASENGIENIISINKIRTGLNKTFNFWKWTDTTLTAKNSSSIDTNGVRKKEIDSDLVTDTTKRQNILNDYRDEFGLVKKELSLTGILGYDTLTVFLLDKVNIDYPTVFNAVSGTVLPRYGTAVYGEARYPTGTWSLTIDANTDWKVLGRSVDLKNATITYDLKEV